MYTASHGRGRYASIFTFNKFFLDRAKDIAVRSLGPTTPLPIGLFKVVFSAVLSALCGVCARGSAPAESKASIRSETLVRVSCLK